MYAKVDIQETKK